MYVIAPELGGPFTVLRGKECTVAFLGYLYNIVYNTHIMTARASYYAVLASLQQVA